MYSKWIKSGFILAILLVSMVSLSMAACPWFIKNELYTAQCGVEKVVPASAGLLANDPGATAVLNWEPIDPKYGTLHVNADGSFVYNPNPDMKSGTYVQFKYNATNGACAAKYAGIAKIQVSCKCRPLVKDITLCLPTTLELIKQKIIDAGVDCIGCGAAPTELDLSDIELAPGKYTYLLKCPGCQAASGTVTLVPGCAAVAPPLEFCEGSVRMTDLPGLIQAACVGEGCGQPVIDYGNVTYNLIPEDPANGFVSGGYYVAICNPGTECGSWARGDITVIQKCTVTAPDLTICEGKKLAEVVALIEATCAPDCDDGPELDTSGVTVDATGNVTGGSYTACCITMGATGVRCESCATGTITVVPRCDVEALPFPMCPGVETKESLEEIGYPAFCGENCPDSTPVIDDTDVTLDVNGFVNGGTYKATCIVGPDCESSATGSIVMRTDCTPQPCPCIADAQPIEVCMGAVNKDALLAIILDGNASCMTNGSGTACDITPNIDLTNVMVDVNGYVTGGSYTATCKPDGLDCAPVVATGTVTAVNCCECKAVAPEIKVCKYTKFDKLEEMIGQAADCIDLDNAHCDATPQIVISVANYNGYVKTSGTYTVTCPSNIPDCVSKATGTVTVVDCPPCNCRATANDVCFEIGKWPNGDPKSYTYGDVLTVVKAKGGKCEGGCSEMSLKFYDGYDEISFSELNWNAEHTYKYRVVCKNSDGTCKDESDKKDLKVKNICPCP